MWFAFVVKVLSWCETLPWCETWRQVHAEMEAGQQQVPTGLDLGLARLRARQQQQQAHSDADSVAEFVSTLKRDRDKFMQDHPLPEPEDEDGETHEGPGEAAPPRWRQRVAVESSDTGEAEGQEEQEGSARGNASDSDVPMAAPASFECAICTSEKPMESAVKVIGCDHPDSLVCGNCMFTEVCGNAAACPVCRASVSALEQVTTGRHYQVGDTALSRDDTQGGVLAEPNHPDACHKCHKFGFLIECDGCKQNRCFKCSGLDWPPKESDPFSCETCDAKARAATPRPPDASATQSDAGDVATAGGGGIGAAQPAARQQVQQRAQEASARAARFQQQQRQRVQAPDIASSGLEPLPGKQVEYAPLETSKVRSTRPLLCTWHHTCSTTRRCPTLAQCSRPRSRRGRPCALGRPICCPPRPIHC